MRRALLLAFCLLATMTAGCMADPGTEDVGDGDQATGTTSGQATGSSDAGPAVAIGDDLGTITYEDSGDMDSAVTQPDCSGGSGSSELHQWNIPATSPDGIGWKASTLTVTLTGSESAIDLDLYLEKGGETLGSSTDTGPDQEETVSVTVQDVTPGQLTIRVQACTSAFMATYDLEGTADMVATEASTATPSESAATSTGDVGAVKVDSYQTDDGRTYYEARRSETFTATLEGTTGTADLDTGAGVIDFTAGRGDDYGLVATLKARGDTEQEARDRLAQMSIAHTAQDGASVLLDVEGVPGGDGSWNHKQVDLVFDAPDAIAWTTFQATASAGLVTVDGVTATSMDVTAGAGLAWVKNCDVDALDVDSDAGAVTIEKTTTDTLDAFAGAGQILVSGSVGNDIDLSAGAGQIMADLKAPTRSGTWDMDAASGQIDLTIVESSDLGYAIDASAATGSVEFDLQDFEETSSNCQYASCTREGQTPGYASRAIQISMGLDVAAGQILVRS